MITLQYIQGESETGATFSGAYHWMAQAIDTSGRAQYDGVGSTPINAVMALAEQMAKAHL